MMNREERMAVIDLNNLIDEMIVKFGKARALELLETRIVLLKSEGTKR